MKKLERDIAAVVLRGKLWEVRDFIIEDSTADIRAKAADYGEQLHNLDLEKIQQYMLNYIKNMSLALNEPLSEPPLAPWEEHDMYECNCKTCVEYIRRWGQLNA